MAIAAAGTTLQILDGSVYVTVAEITSLDGPALEVPAVPTSHLGTTKKTYRAGVPDAGEVSGSLWFNPEDSSHDLLYDLWDSPADATVRINTSIGTVYDFTGILTNFSPSYGDLDENVTADFTFKVDGDITVTPAA